MSWLDPNKVRQITVVGSKKMAVYDDVATLDKIRVYDKGVDVPTPTTSFGEFQLSYRYGEIRIPHVASTEPLRLECQHFLECVQPGSRLLTDGAQGLAVVRILETAQAALKTPSMLSLSTGRAPSTNGHRIDGNANGHTSNTNGNGQAPGMNGHPVLVGATREQHAPDGVE